MSTTMRVEVVNRLATMRERGISDTEIAEYLLYNYMSGYDAADALECLADDNDFTFEEEEEEEPECEICGQYLNLDGECEDCDSESENGEA